MKYLLATLLLLIFCNALQAQFYIGFSRQKVKHETDSYMRSNHYKNYTVTDSAYITDVVLHDTLVQPVTFRYEFTPKGKCFGKVVSANCYECIEKSLLFALDQHKYEWVKLNDSTWISSLKHSLQMTLNKEVDGVSSLEIRQMIWSKSVYFDLLSTRLQ
ncbi:hypothetical protein HHL16_11650 [Pseudoflavitalea sp. G-6-1-2]|uniref:hypothetical protein n=1 Tax=Pseudoflavitalea sp. G-6-1-2 TaxID=2728841 RepID=UPI00146B9A4A|nr:hypothetical protein [Pseudoflavitalea sp. G-6-1-2]NML21533.1 hypothetical protein [Pseudoflavitalea sp. G-6-1-2]